MGTRHDTRTLRPPAAPAARVADPADRRTMEAQMSDEADRRFEDVRAQMAEWERQIALLRDEGFRVWRREVAVTAADQQVWAKITPLNGVPDEPGFVPVALGMPSEQDLAATATAVFRALAGPLTAACLAALLPIAPEHPDAIPGVATMLRELFSKELVNFAGQVVDGAERVAREVATYGPGGQP